MNIVQMPHKQCAANFDSIVIATII